METREGEGEGLEEKRWNWERRGRKMGEVGFIGWGGGLGELNSSPWKIAKDSRSGKKKI